MRAERQRSGSSPHAKLKASRVTPTRVTHGKTANTDKPEVRMLCRDKGPANSIGEQASRADVSETSRHRNQSFPHDGKRRGSRQMS